MSNVEDGLFSRMSSEFNRSYGALPQTYIASHALVAMLSARLEWLTGVLVNNAHAQLGWPKDQKVWPYKMSARFRWLRSAIRQPGVLSKVSTAGETFLEAAERLNDARNDILHSAILGHAPDGRLYVARVTTDRKGDQLKLEEGSAWTIEIVERVALDLVQCEKLGLDFGRALLDV